MRLHKHLLAYCVNDKPDIENKYYHNKQCIPHSHLPSVLFQNSVPFWANSQFSLLFISSLEFALVSLVIQMLSDPIRNLHSTLFHCLHFMIWAENWNSKLNTQNPTLQIIASIECVMCKLSKQIITHFVVFWYLGTTFSISISHLMSLQSTQRSGMWHKRFDCICGNLIWSLKSLNQLYRSIHGGLWSFGHQVILPFIHLIRSRNDNKIKS